MSIELAGEGGTLTVSTGAVSQIVMRAAESVDGVRVRRRRRLDVTVEDGSAHVALPLTLAYGLVVPDAARDVQQRVAAALATMLGCEIAAVDVAVEGLDE
jgi:uncharacterized alkaline shock family protein YloU